MNLDFDVDNVDATEFGVGRQLGTDRTFVAIPVLLTVQVELQNIAISTVQRMGVVLNLPQLSILPKSTRVKSI